jgi:hypothetical protein
VGRAKIVNRASIRQVLEVRTGLFGRDLMAAGVHNGPYNGLSAWGVYRVQTVKLISVTRGIVEELNFSLCILTVWVAAFLILSAAVIVLVVTRPLALLVFMELQ